MRKGRNRKQRVNKNEKAAGNCFRACAESEQGMWVKVGDTCTRANSGEANFRVPSAKLVVPLSPLAVSIRLPFQFPSFRANTVSVRTGKRQILENFQSYLVPFRCGN